MRISLRWKRPAPLDILTQAMPWGHFRTWIAAVLKRPELLGNRTQAWKIYETILKRITVSWPLSSPSDWIARFVYHILQTFHHKSALNLGIGAFEGRSTAFVPAILNGEALITVVDPFTQYVEIKDTKNRNAFDAFSANESIGAKDVVRVPKGRSIDHLPKLIDAGEQFDPWAAT